MTSVLGKIVLGRWVLGTVGGAGVVATIAGPWSMVIGVDARQPRIEAAAYQPRVEAAAQTMVRA
jgi:hypothetical protein